MQKSVLELAQILEGKLIGDGSQVIQGVAPAGNVTPQLITFAESAKYLKEAEQRQAGAIVVTPDVTASSSPLIQVKSPRVAFAKALELFYPFQKPAAGIHPTAVISDKAHIDKGVTVGPYVVIEEGATIEQGVVIGANSYIGKKSLIKEGSFLYPSVIVYHETVIGKQVVIHSGTVIGGDGFGYADQGEKRVKVPQVGNVVIEDDVEIGCNVCIDRGTIGSTLVKQGVKVDNLVQIAHNVVVSENVLLCAQVGISGSSSIGKNAVLAGQVGIGDHVQIGEYAIIGAQAGVPTKKKIQPKTIAFGLPARPIQEWKENYAYNQRVPLIIKKLEERIAALEAKIAGTLVS